MQWSFQMLPSDSWPSWDPDASAYTKSCSRILGAILSFLTSNNMSKYLQPKCTYDVRHASSHSGCTVVIPCWRVLTNLQRWMCCWSRALRQDSYGKPAAEPTMPQSWLVLTGGWWNTIDFKIQLVTYLTLHNRCFSRQMFWLLVAGKLQIWLMPLNNGCTLFRCVRARVLVLCKLALQQSFLTRPNARQPSLMLITPVLFPQWQAKMSCH